MRSCWSEGWCAEGAPSPREDSARYIRAVQGPDEELFDRLFGGSHEVTVWCEPEHDIHHSCQHDTGRGCACDPSRSCKHEPVLAGMLDPALDGLPNPLYEPEAM